MTGRAIRVPALYCGPPGSANGGCLAGLRAGTRTDPLELRDIPSDAALAERLAQMRSAMDSVLAITPGERTGASGVHANGSVPRNLAYLKK